MMMRDIVGVLDMDGFMIGKRFYCKELGILKVGDVAARSYYFYLGIRWVDLCAKDRKSCRYVMRNIHKLPFGVPYGVKASRITELGNIVGGFYHEVKQTERSVLAYKGGYYERDLLTRLDIPSIDLEKFGCPKAEILINELVWLETCRRHMVPNAYAHCAKVEVEAYAQWLKKQ